MKTAHTTLAQLVEDLENAPAHPRRPRQYGSPISVWVSSEEHDRYSRLQQLTGRRFGKKVREAIAALMDAAEARVG